MENQMHDYRTLSSLKNALHVLNCFTMDRPEKGITEIAEELGLSKSTVHRVMTTLAEEGFVRRDERTHRYRLGLSVLSLGGIIMSNLEIYREGQHLLESFVNRFDETVHLAVLEDYSTVYVSKLECKHPIQILTHLGRKNPLHCTSSGKAILAYQTPEFVDDVLRRGLEKVTPNTIADPDALLQSLARVREDGYAMSRGELRGGVHSIAVPVRDYTRAVIGAVTVVGPAERFTDAKMLSIARTLRGIAAEISSRLGYYERRR
ncbi:IclR family transcriptional regulator [Alicyclobacillus fastidiosus]|uniref:IclR family transcriptional regulator n=1 Tax=Alicyclobacillus fastidiosus TaxID=392011 RepID=A0ABY6ZL98_9BACL|nr:IclR family transcriptional regulator [Alicyclobacillus fastidiosus]WAH43695.1 IclR family transcriptional regulator [Alicyclobacillus fastidiosus]GMA59902.1 IclR family transcriptional regulator [Alicyclobacillus fastidiosus]